MCVTGKLPGNCGSEIKEDWCIALVDDVVGVQVSILGKVGQGVDDSRNELDKVLVGLNTCVSPSFVNCGSCPAFDWARVCLLDL